MKKHDLEYIKSIASKIRCDIIKMTYLAGSQGAHIGGGLSLVEILASLYFGALKYDVACPENPDRDRVVLSKGHGAIAWYSALNHAGFIPQEDLWTYKSNKTYITSHPGVHKDKGIEFASGSLGQGVSLGAGICMALKKDENLNSRVFVIVGDGECNEGSVWEAAAFAYAQKLNNLVCIVDRNHLQYDGDTKEVMDMGDLISKWKAFGWDVENIDGHDIESLCEAFNKKTNNPIAIICNTIKGKGVSFIENDYKWHNARLTEEQYKKALAEQGVEV